MSKELTPEEKVTAEIAGYVDRARKAQKKLDHYTQKQVDELVRACAKVLLSANTM